MAINTSKIKNYIDAGLNVIISGPSGTGKTAMITEATESLGLKTKYYSASTLDPFADLVGIPVPNESTRSVDYYRPREVDEAEVIFFDELNRAEVKTRNAVFEIIQFRSINGEKLPNLKTVVAAINPVSEEYDTEELDLALFDRFDSYLESEVVADYPYFKRKYGADYARVGVKMFNDYQKDYNNKNRSSKNEIGYFSPRRLEKLMSTFALFPNESTIREVLPPDVVVSAKYVADQFNTALGNKKKKQNNAPTAKKSASGSDEEWRKRYDLQVQMPNGDFTTRGNSIMFMRVYRWAQVNGAVVDLDALRVRVANALSKPGVGPVKISYFSEVIDDMTISERRIIFNTWDQNKRRTMRNRFPEDQYGWQIPVV